MALVPLKQRIKVYPAGIKDEWGNGTEPEPYTLKARVDEVVEVVPDRLGEVAVSGMTIMLDKLAAITYDDTIEYTNELGVTVKRKPIKIEPVRLPSGKPTLTTIYC